MCFGSAHSLAATGCNVNAGLVVGNGDSYWRHTAGRSRARTRRTTRVSCTPCQACNKKLGGAHVLQKLTGNRGGECGLKQVQGQRHGQYEGGLDEQAVLQHANAPGYADAPPPFFMSSRELDHGIQLSEEKRR